jgi:hypothetical protein
VGAACELADIVGGPLTHSPTISTQLHYLATRYLPMPASVAPLFLESSGGA